MVAPTDGYEPGTRQDGGGFKLILLESETRPRGKTCSQWLSLKLQRFEYCALPDEPATDQPTISPDRHGNWGFDFVRDLRFIEDFRCWSLSMANCHDGQIQKVGAMIACDPPGVKVAPWRADRQPYQGLKLVDCGRACRGGNADALARDGGHDRGVVHDGAAHLVKIVEEMAVDPIGLRM